MIQDKMALYKIAFTYILTVVLVEAQRPFYAGSRPIGFPVIESESGLSQLGENSGAPIEAKGDANLINRIEQMPIDKRPFWYLNAKQYDDLRKNPQTYPLRPSGFARGFDYLGSSSYSFIALHIKYLFLLCTFEFIQTALAEAQRPFYAGLRPIGYPAVESAPLFNRFGENSGAPIEAKGDANLINRIEQMPIDKRPFWYLNAKQYDIIRKNPQTYPQRPSGFISG
ncbi:unnamed protein product [Leptidea sinapis]|uniref:Uncharacterized protein n=1 Tax=Leptidea sinapis TaxID=189913 RepID=A0A5E4QUR6_9NEOP|nr:unnamed protein product [Leptidea sinapis]